MSKIRKPIRGLIGTGTRRGPLYVPPELKEPGKHYCWVNDSGYQLDEYLDSGYNLTPAKEGFKGHIGDRGLRDGSDVSGSYVSKKVGVDAGGHAVRAYLLNISMEDYEAQQEALAREVDDTEARLNKKRSGSDSFAELTVKQEDNPSD